MNKYEKLIIVSYIIGAIGLLCIVGGITFEIVDFYNDYKCSTTSDIKWYYENNCMRYWKD